MAIPLQQRTVTILTALSEVIQQDIDECDIIFHELSQLNIAQQDILDAGRDLTTPFSGIEQYIERTVTGYSDPYFYKHFRMTRLDFEMLTRKMSPLLNINGSASCVPTETKLFITLWTLGNLESFRGIGDRFGMQMGTVHFIFLATCRGFRINSEEFIKWPQREDYREIANNFVFPNAIGCIDSSYIKIRQPLQQCYAYTNRKKFCSMTLQAVCKTNREFIDASTGYPSSMHDASVFAHSKIGRNIARLLADTPYHLIADSAYGLTTVLMKPYEDNGRLDEHQRNYNRILSSSRSVIERAFSYMKGKWRRLRYLDMLLLNRIPDVIMTACCLHNFIIQAGDVNEEDFDDEVIEDDEDPEDYGEVDDELGDVLATRKRNAIKYLLCN